MTRYVVTFTKAHSVVNMFGASETQVTADMAQRGYIVESIRPCYTLKG